MTVTEHRTAAPAALAASAVDDSAPYPPRYWWLKRIALATALLFAGLVALRLWWGWEANRRLAAEIARIRAAGEPILPEDFYPPAVSDDENAAKLYEAAFMALGLTADETKLIYECSEAMDPSAEKCAGRGRIISSRTAFFDLLRGARTRHAIDWGLRYRTPAITTPVWTNLGAARDTAGLMALAAWHYHAEGRDAAAIEVVCDADLLARNLARQPLLIGIVSAWACHAKAVRDPLEAILPSLCLRRGTTEPMEKCVDTDRVRSLVDSLLDDSAWDKAFVDALHAERMLCVDMETAVRQGALGSTLLISGFSRPAVAAGWWQWVWDRAFLPMLTLDALRASHGITAHIDAVQQANFRFVVRNPTPGGTEDTAFGLIYRPLSTGHDSWPGRAVEMHFRSVACRRLSATALAIRMFEVERGRKPERLGELVPDYLAKVPSDPFSPTGDNIRYLPDAQPAVLYSVGANGIDDGGAFRPDRWNLPDEVFVLRRTVAAAAKPGAPQATPRTAPTSVDTRKNSPTPR
ncbi:MAG: hypothetical protein HY763_11130 [Planctomycetes bacterium]|nr:hypothetical protein [Planctomycetota bacterium]